MVQIQGRIWKTGNGYVITVPTAFIKGKVLDLKKEYIFQIEQGEILKKATESQTTKPAYLSQVILETSAGPLYIERVAR